MLGYLYQMKPMLYYFSFLKPVRITKEVNPKVVHAIAYLHFNASNIRLKDTLIPDLVITEDPPYPVQLQYNYQGFITE